MKPLILTLLATTFLYNPSLSLPSNPTTPSIHPTTNTTKARTWLDHPNPLLTTWPPLPHRVRMAWYPDIFLDFTHAHRTGTPAQTAQALDLLRYEIFYLTAHPYTYAPQSLIIHKKPAGVHITCESGRASELQNPKWTGVLLLHMLRAMEGLIGRWGMREVVWGLWVEEDKVNMCGIWLDGGLGARRGRGAS